MTRVLILVDHLKPYGAQRVTIDLARGLAAAGEHVCVVMYKAPGTSDTRPDGLEIIALRRRTRNVFGLLEVSVKLRRLLVAGKYDRCIAIMTYANIAMSFATVGIRADVRTIATEHNIYSVTHRGVKWKIVRPLMRRIYAMCSGVVGVSNDVARDLEASIHLAAGSVRTIYNPVDVDAIRRHASAEVGPLPWPPESVVYAIVGALKPAKGHRLALEIVASSAPHVVMCVVGDGALRSELMSYAERLGVGHRVYWMGWQDNPWSWMRNADVLVVPSTYEGFGLVVGEAAAVGLPAVCSNAPGLAEIARMFGSTIVESRDPRAWSRATAAASRRPSAAEVDARAMDEVSLTGVADKYLRS
jgi:glycosyltransferase involved in cell wall biosynthesis